MAVRQEGFVALWHNIPPDVDEEYNLVHTREHVPDYVANAADRGGIEFGRRYAEGDGQLPRYFMFYPARDMSAFQRLAAKPWPEHPGGTSDWFNSIINQYRDSWRNNCRLIDSVGGGTGGAALSMIMRLSDEAAGGGATVKTVLSELISIPQVLGVTFGLTDPAIEPNRPTLSADDAPVGVMVIESFNRLRLAQAVAPIRDLLVRRGIALEEPRYGLYQLAYELRPESLDRIAAFGGHEKRW
ncbi:hypothetical protein FJ945_20330 [Mesorhizobium sp. B2-4-9]|uniref:hypothetical protein n=1 Tax=Mesorhizobium sp. B2-4-9 TaxID=2589940 RepID=UPI00112AA5E0|nr:hypothetical protein [Mesorhizobium sp. B2-4-9]TPL21073.1 hypothetical protein FJ945_20330 [Mesorhizobium sp. B2-4-9]